MLRLVLLIAGLSACTSLRSDKAQRLRIEVGEIKEIRLPGQGDASMQLIGTSDNNEVVEVSRRELAPAVDTLQATRSGPSIFQIKGVTTGTANVVFTEKRPEEVGSGRIRKTYSVQVVTKYLVPHRYQSKRVRNVPDPF